MLNNISTRIFLVNFVTINLFHISTLHCFPSRIIINNLIRSFPLRFVSLNVKIDLSNK